MFVDGLRSAGYDATICKSQRDKDPSFPAGEYEYVDEVVAADGGWHLQVGFRGGAADEVLPLRPPNPSVAIRRPIRSAPADRCPRAAGGGAELEEKGHPHSAMEAAGLQAGQVVLP